MAGPQRQLPRASAEGSPMSYLDLLLPNFNKIIMTVIGPGSLAAHLKKYDHHDDPVHHWVSARHSDDTERPRSPWNAVALDRHETFLPFPVAA